MRKPAPRSGPRGAIVLAALALAGCTPALVAPGPGVAAPAAWDEADPHAPTARAPHDGWWQHFRSRELESLISEALVGNPDLAAATERVVQAEIALRSAGATLFPAVNLEAATGLQTTDSGSASGTTRSSSLGVAMGYEIDLWGSKSLQRDGARAQLAATRHDHDAARLSLRAGVASAYLHLLAQRERLAIAEGNLAIAERLFALVEARHRHGAASALDVSRQRSTVLAQRDAILPLRVQERQMLRALALLLGRVPQGFEITGIGLLALSVPDPAVPLPGELLARRPDLAATEARLVAADANIAIARAALFPLKLSLSLASTADSSALALTGLGSPTSTASITLSLLQAVFDGGRLRAQVETTESQRRELLENYRARTLAALKEVEDALAAAARSRHQEATQHEIRSEAERALRLSELRYRSGSDRLDTLLDAQRSLFSAQDQLVQQRLARLSAAIDLYKALGGGWSSPPGDPAP